MKAWYERNVLPRLLKSAMGRNEFENIRPQVISKAHGIVLEIGVGAGNNFPFYTNVSKLYALEPSAELIEMARSRHVDIPVEFLVTGAEKIPLADNSIDTVVSTWTLCSVGSPENVMREIKRVLKPGGRVLFVDHGLSPHGLIRIVQKVLTPLTKHFTGNCHMDRDIMQLIRSAGFEVSEVSHPREDFKPLMCNYQGVGISK